MLKNNKGFMLAEVVVTSTIVLTCLISFYTTFTKLYSAYEVRSRYYNIDGVYASRNMIKHLINNLELNEIFSSKTSGFIGDNYLYLIKDGTCNKDIITSCNDSTSSDYLYVSSLIELYNINNMIIMEWSESIISDSDDSIINTASGMNETFKDYFNDYVKKHYDFSSNSEYNYLVITEYKAENSKRDEYNYSSISLR